MLPFKDEPTQEQPSKPKTVKATTCHPGQLCVIFDNCFKIQCIVLPGCLAAHPLFNSVEVAFCPELSQNKYLGLQLGEQVLCIGSSHLLRSCIRKYNTCSNALLYLWSLILLCGNVESNPGSTNGNDT